MLCPAGWISDKASNLYANVALNIKICADMFMCRCQPCPINHFQASANLCAACSFGYRSVFSASVVCEPCPLGMVGHILGGCRACSPGTYRSSESLNCTVCEAGTYSGNGYPACIPCKLGEYSNGVGSAKCLPCSAGTYATKKSSYCKPCEINSASNLSMTPMCPTCLHGSAAPFTGMSECIPCPAQQNTSSLILLIPQRFRANVSEADLLSAAAAIDASCFQTPDRTRNNLNFDEITTSSDSVIAIFCTVAGIILIVGLYFLKRSCATAAPADHPVRDVKIPEVNVSISQVPEDIRSKIMVRLGGTYFHQLIERRQRVSEAEPVDIELCSVPGAPVDQTEQLEDIVPEASALRTLPQIPGEIHEGDESIGVASGQPAQNSGEREHAQQTTTLPKQYQGKKYSIDFENVRCVA